MCSEQLTSAGLSTVQEYNRQETQLSLTNRATHYAVCNGVADSLKHAHSNVDYRAKSGRGWSNGTRVDTEIRLKNQAPRVPLFKATQGHRNY